MLLVVILLKKNKEKNKGRASFFQELAQMFAVWDFFPWCLLSLMYIETCSAHTNEGSADVQRALGSSRAHRAPLGFPAGGRTGPAPARAVGAAQPVQTKRREMEL